MAAIASGPLKRTLLVSVGVVLVAAELVRGADVTLRNETWAVAVDPETLAVMATPAKGEGIPVSAGQAELGRVEGLKSGESAAGWGYVDKGVAVEVGLDRDTLTVHFKADHPGVFTWPVVPGKSAATAFVLPCFEGLYVPADDGEWAKYLADHSPMDTTADLSMPFWGVQTGGRTLTYLLVNPFGNEMAFRDEGGRVGVALTHTFRANWNVKEYEVRVSLGGGSPVEPARRYRKYLMETKQFVSLKEKIERTPEAGKLLGAPHVYLWGGDVIGRDDVRDYKGLAGEIVREAKAEGASAGKRVWGMMGEEAKKVFAGLPEAEWVDQYMKGVVAGELSRSLTREELAAAYGKFLKPAETWGDGVSAKMIGRLREAGLDRLRIAVSDAGDLRKNPGAVRAAREAGYLIGPYDSYHSIHKTGQTDTWETAQFDDPALYESGAVIKQDGTPIKGFQQKGHILSPLAARPAVERRVNAWMKDFPGANLWFMDCDAFGQLYDDFSPVHPATQFEDMNARLSRLAWIRDTYHCVIGSEGGSSYAAGVLHFTEGPETPVIGWGDVDLQKDKASPYYLGAYYPPDGPVVFFKPVPLKPSYKKFFFDPRYRVPLYQVALHDSVIATHHWTFGSFKLSDLMQTREMLELLYGVPPLYHLNPAEFAKRKDEILKHYAFFSPLHRETALLPMTEFEYLTADRMVQRTRFGEAVEVVANFSGEAYEYGGRSVPAQSVTCIHLVTGEAKTYQP